MESLNELYVGKPWNLPNYGNEITLDGMKVCNLLDPHPDYLWYGYKGVKRVANSIGTSLFLGPNFPRYEFSERMPLYCPESVKWNRFLYYAMKNPKLFDSLPDRMKSRVLTSLTLFFIRWSG